MFDFEKNLLDYTVFGDDHLQMLPIKFYENFQFCEYIFPKIYVHDTQVLRPILFLLHGMFQLIYS